MLSDTKTSSTEKTKEFVLENFKENQKSLPIYEVLSEVEKGYKDNGKEHYEYSDYIKESRKIVEKAEAEAEKIQKTAFEKGYRDGVEKGLLDVQEDCVAKTEAFGEKLEEIINSIETLWSRMLEDNRENLLRLVIESTKVVICGEIKTNPDVILNVLRKVFQKVQDSQKVHITVNPEDLDIIKQNKKDLFDILGKGKKLVISKDPDLKVGGCRVDVENQGIDAGIDSMIREMERTLLKEFLPSAF